MPIKINRRDLLRAMRNLGAGLPTLGLLDRSLRMSGAASSLLPQNMVSGRRVVPQTSPLGVTFVNVAQAAGIRQPTIFGGVEKNVYLLETTGCGAAFFDYDNDGWLDLFLVNGTRLEGFPKGQEPTNRLYKNNRDGTFTDVTRKAGLVHSGWGQGCCIGDYDNDGREDLFISYFGRNVLYHNNGDGTLSDVSQTAGVTGTRTRWGSGCAFVDYDRDGYLDLFVANYIEGDLKSFPLPESGPCLYKGILVACGPPGLQGASNILYHNNGDGTFTDVSEKAGITKTDGTYGLGVLTADFDNDGWPDIYVANDSQPSALYHNNHDGTFTDIGVMAGCAYSQDGKPQAGMGTMAADYDCDGWMDILRTDFSEDTPALYHNIGKGMFDDVTFAAGLGINTRFLGWGCGFFDMDNDGWADILVVNGHIYPEIEKADLGIHYHERKVLYRNLGNGRFEDVSEEVAGAILEPVSGRGCAVGDFDNDGDLDVLINPVNDIPQLLRCDSSTGNHWLKIRTHGVKSNRSGIGARIKVVTGDHQQIDEVRSGGSWGSQNDLRVHFGLGKTTTVDRVEIHWPSGQVDTLENVAADQLVHVQEGRGIVKGVVGRPSAG